MRLRVDLRGLPRRNIRLSPTFTLDQMGCEQGIDEGRFAKSSLTLHISLQMLKPHPSSDRCFEVEHTDDHDVELESAFEEFVLDLAGDY